MNLTTTNYLFPTKEGRFQRWRRLSFCPPLRDGRCGPMRGALPLREQVVRLGFYSPKWGGLCPHAPIGRALRPILREFMQGWQPLHPPVGLPGPHPGFLSFHDERNQRRAGATPLDPQCVIAALFALAALRFGSRRATLYLQPRPICHFERVGKPVFVSLQAIPGLHPLFLIRGSEGGMPSRMFEGLSYHNQYC